MPANVEDMLGNAAGARHFLDEADAMAAEACDYVATIELVQAETVHAFYEGDMEVVTAKSSEDASLSRDAGGRGPDCAVTRTVVFELRRRDTGGLVHAYHTEGAALAFVRDVIFIGGRDQAACFALEVRDELGQIRTLAEGPALIQRALEDRAE